MKKAALPIIFIFFALISFAMPHHALAAWSPPNIWDPNTLKGPLVSCTGNYSAASPNHLDQCTNLCQLIFAAINVVYFGMAFVLWILAPIFFAVGGLMYMFSGSNPEAIGRAKKTLIATFIGILIVVCGWLLINTFIAVFGIIGIGGFGNSACQFTSS